MVSTLSGENFNLCRESECERPNDMVEISFGRSPGMSEDKLFRIERYISAVEESETSLRDNWGNLLMALALKGQLITSHHAIEYHTKFRISDGQ